MSCPGDATTIFLCGDVMTGRGVDQILDYPSGPELAEPWVRDARDYVAIAEAHSGPIAAPVPPEYIWGDARDELARVKPAARIANLETAVTANDARWPGKGIHYRMHPANVAAVSNTYLDVCALANNHVLDYGHPGLEETLRVLRHVGLRTAGAGLTLDEARAPAIVPCPDGPRVLVFAFALATSGVPAAWAAGADRAGVDLCRDLSDATADGVLARVRSARRRGDRVVASVHWGPNWGYDVSRDERRFAHRLIDGGVDVVHGHSSHHPRPLEVHRGGLILYGCGDFIDDYEGIEGHEAYRDDLVLMYFASFASDGGPLTGLEMTPMQIRKMRLTRPRGADVAWVQETLDRISMPFGVRVEAAPGGTLTARFEVQAPRP